MARRILFPLPLWERVARASDSEREPGEGSVTLVRLSPLTRPRSASPPLATLSHKGRGEASRGIDVSIQSVAGRSFFTSASPGSTEAPSTYLKSIMVPLPFSSAILPTKQPIVAW